MTDRPATSCEAKVDMGLILELAGRGDLIALEALKQTASYLGLGLAPIIYALNPEAIIIGGRMAEVWSLVEKQMIDSCARRVSSLYLESTKIFPSTLHTKPSLMGAVALVLAQNFAAPNIV
jgi:predicted NBD/HSP70 family sugar kinase